MKVILLENIPKVGNKYEVATVADGYALNYLIPQQKAEFASPEAINRIQKMEESIAKERAATHAELKEKLKEIDGKIIQFALPASDEGRLYASLNEAELIEALNEQFEATYTLDQTNFTPIKEVGETEFEISLDDESATVTVVVSGDEDEENK